MKTPRWFYESGLQQVGHPAIDHIFVEKNKCGFIEVSVRPYSASQEQIKQIVHICAAHNICFSISGATTYSHHDTFVIKFWLAADEKKYSNTSSTDKLFNLSGGNDGEHLSQFRAA